MKYLIGIFVIIFSSSLIASPFSCGEKIKVSEHTSGDVSINLVETIQNEKSVIYQLTNNSNNKLILQGTRNEDGVFSIYPNDSDIWRLDLKKQDIGWEWLLLTLGEYLANAELIVNPKETVKIISVVGGKEDFDIDINNYAYRLFLISYDKRVILSEPYCFTKK